MDDFINSHTLTETLQFWGATLPNSPLISGGGTTISHGSQTSRIGTLDRSILTDATPDSPLTCRISNGSLEELQLLVEEILKYHDQIERLTQKRKSLMKEMNNLKSTLSSKMIENKIDSIQKNGLHFNLVEPKSHGQNKKTKTVSFHKDVS